MKFTAGLIAFLGLPALVWSYTSSSGDFTCPNPLQNSPGVRIDENSGYVGFSNDWGQRYRVETEPQTDEGRQLEAKYGRQKYLEALLKSYYYPLLIQRAVPDAAILKERYEPALHAGASVIHVRMPKAGLEKTTIDTGTGARKTIRMDTVRGILVFVEKRRTVYVSSELSPIEREGKHRRPDEAAQRSIELDKQLLNFARQVQVLD